MTFINEIKNVGPELTLEQYKKLGQKLNDIRYGQVDIKSNFSEQLGSDRFEGSLAKLIDKLDELRMDLINKATIENSEIPAIDLVKFYY